LGLGGCDDKTGSPQRDAATDTAIARSVTNASGTCTVVGDGTRPEHDASGSTWVPDCQNPLRREYYRIYQQSPTSAYTIPRLDGAPMLAPACTDANHPLAPLLRKYELCAEATTTEQVDRINHMAPADALQITHFLHMNLRFAASTEAHQIVPYAFGSDIIAACDLHPAQNSSALNVFCNRERELARTGIGVGTTTEGPGAVELALRLNELYGIP
jgi:hypothetical protein